MFPPHGNGFPRRVSPFINVPDDPERLIPCAQTFPPTALSIPRIISLFLHDHWADSHVLGGVGLV